MKAFLFLVVCTAAAGVLFPVNAQVTNLKVRGVSSNFTMTSGDTIMWEYNIPTAGGTVFGEIWYDVNGNGTIEPGTDVAKFLFIQTDGSMNGNGGPPDLDGAADGHVIFGQPVGVAPGKYVFRFTFNSMSAVEAGTVTALASPAHLISGHVTPPAGKSAANINVVVHRPNGGGDLDFWDAYTDAGGDYSIQMNSDTAGNPWQVRIENNPYPPASISPQGIDVDIVSGNYSGNDFTLTAAAAQVDGTVKDDLGNPALSHDVSLNRNDNLVYAQGRLDITGGFQIGLASGDLGPHTWHLQTNSGNNNGNTTTELIAQRDVPVIALNDSLFYNLVVYSANTTISGTVTVNGSAPGFPIQIQASSTDTALAQTTSDSASGSYSLQVTDKIHNYTLTPLFLPPNYIFSNIVAHPGESGIDIAITISSVKERGSGIPASYALKQNYPNPFNPTTEIDYDIPAASHVTLTVFNVLGQEVSRVVDLDQAPGKYRATVDASRLSSGVYIYRLIARSGSPLSPKVFSSARKLVVMK